MKDLTWTWSEVIDAVGGTGAAADGLSQTKSTVSGWRERGIPSRHWISVVDFACSLGRKDISLSVLASLAAREHSEART